MSSTRPEIRQVLAELRALPPDWHGAGMMSTGALQAIARFSREFLESSAETGSGKSTLLLSHLSRRHVVFSVDASGSLSRVRQSPLLARDRVTFVEGPSQITLQRFAFEAPLDFALIDGCHSFPSPEIDYFHLYPHLAPGAVLALDDIHIPTIRNLYRFLREDDMFRPVGRAGNTAFFRRTSARTFDPLYGDWFEQRFNARHFPAIERLKQRIPPSARATIKRLLGRS